MDDYDTHNQYGNGKYVQEEIKVYLEPVLLDKWLGCVKAGDIVTVIGVLDEVYYTVDVKRQHYRCDNCLLVVIVFTLFWENVIIFLH